MDTLGRIKTLGEEIAAVSAEAQRRIDDLQAERAELITDLRSNGWSLAGIAEVLGVSKTRVRQFEEGQPSNAERLRRRHRRDQTASKPAASGQERR